MASTKIHLQDCLLSALLIAMAIGKVHPKSLSCANNPSIPMDTLYPSTSILALHPMDEAPLTGGADQATSPVCPTGALRADSDSPLSKRQTCPTDTVINFDRNRIPAVIQEARCLCTGCLDHFTGQESPFLQCEEVKYQMPVLRNKNSCAQGLVKYELTYEQITVGCACPQFLP